MTPAEVIDAYVADVARCLPGKMRWDVAQELRELLTESLQEQSGGRPDEAQALIVVRAFGPPAEVAARYHPAVALIAPEDTRDFFLLSIVGYGVVGVAAEVANAASGVRTHGVEPLAWLGLMFLAFAIKGWAQRSTPREQRSWRKPRWRSDDVKWGWVIADLVSTLLFIPLYLDPQGVLDILSGGYLHQFNLAYTDSFQHWSRISWIALLCVIHAGLMASAMLQRRWTALVRWADVFVQIDLVLQVGWHLHYGHIFVDPQIEAIARPIAAFCALGWAMMAGLMAWRELGRIPTPGRPHRSPAPAA